MILDTKLMVATSEIIKQIVVYSVGETTLNSDKSDDP